MADKPHVYRVPTGHKIAGKMKPGEVMHTRMKMMDPDEASEGDEGTYPMQEESAELAKAEAPSGTPPKGTGRVDPIQRLKMKRALKGAD